MSCRGANATSVAWTAWLATLAFAFVLASVPVPPAANVALAAAAESAVPLHAGVSHHDPSHDHARVAAEPIFEQHLIAGGHDYEDFGSFGRLKHQVRVIWLCFGCVVQHADIETAAWPCV